MGLVKVGKHTYVRLSRRSLCDNCKADVCLFNHGERMTECDRYEPKLTALKKCNSCGVLFDVSCNFQALDYDICKECNKRTSELFASHS